MQGQVEIRTIVEGQNLQLMIENSGEGIQEEVVQRLGERFTAPWAREHKVQVWDCRFVKRLCSYIRPRLIMRRQFWVGLKFH